MTRTQLLRSAPFYVALGVITILGTNAWLHPVLGGGLRPRELKPRDEAKYPECRSNTVWHRLEVIPDREGQPRFDLLVDAWYGGSRGAVKDRRGRVWPAGPIYSQAFIRVNVFSGTRTDGEPLLRKDYEAFRIPAGRLAAETHVTLPLKRRGEYTVMVSLLSRVPVNYHHGDMVTRTEKVFAQETLTVTDRVPGDPPPECRCK